MYLKFALLKHMIKGSIQFRLIVHTVALNKSDPIIPTYYA